METRIVKYSPLNCERIFHWHIFVIAIGSRRNVLALSIETVLVLSFRGTDKLKGKKIWRAATHGLQVINWPGSPPLHVPTPSSSSANVFFPFFVSFLPVFVRKTFCLSNILIRPHVFLGKTGSHSLIVCDIAGSCNHTSCWDVIFCVLYRGKNIEYLRTLWQEKGENLKCRSWLFFILFCTMTNKCTINWQIIVLLHVSKLLCHPQGDRS